MIFFLISFVLVLLIVGILLLVKGFTVQGIIFIAGGLILLIIIIYHYERKRKRNLVNNCTDCGYLPDCGIPDCDIPDCHHHAPDCTPDCDCSPDCHI